jgi:N-carbamoylputrescine amidase
MTMRIALIQQHATKDKQANLARGLDAAHRAAKEGADCICFAELAFEWFHPQRRAEGDVSALAEPVPGPITDAFCALAADHRVVVVPNLFERDGDKCYDCSPVIDADGSLLGRARMVHITDYDRFHEKGYYAPGDVGAPVFETAVGRIGVAICYDRHFPEYMRALALHRADLVIVPQAGAVDEWPAGLYEAEMQVAAFQNGYHIALCNRVGKEDCVTFAGESFVCGPDGRMIDRAPKGEDHILLADVDLSANEESHAQRLFLKDRRPKLYGRWLAT